MVNEKPSTLSLAKYDVPASEIVDVSRVVPMNKTANRGTLVMRVTPEGRILDKEVLLVTGAFVSGRAGDPDAIKTVYVRRLQSNTAGELEIISNEQYEYDPYLTVIKIGYIDYLAPENKKLFETLGTGM